MGKTELLNDNELQQVSGGAIVSRDKNKITHDIEFGYIYHIYNESPYVNADYCFVSLSQAGRYKFVEYLPELVYVDNAVQITDQATSYQITYTGRCDLIFANNNK